MARTLKERGENPAYLLELQNSLHPEYTKDDSQDRKIYQDVMHVLYKRYGLPYIKKEKFLLDNLLLI